MDARRSAREAFLKGDPLPTKPEPAARERDVEKEGTKQQLISATRPTNSPRDVEGYVGFASLPNQVYRKSVKRGFEFNLMVVGESGTGKSTLINSLFLTDIYGPDYPGPSKRIKKTMQVESTQVLLKEGGVQLRLTVVDMPGFGDQVDNSNCWQPVVNFVESKFQDYLNSDSKVNRNLVPDNRIHCCLYFLSPNGHGLKPIDIEFMKNLHDKVNIVPVISKADTMTPDECREFKKTILNEIAQNKISIYDFPNSADEEENKMLKKLKERVPFAVVGSNIVIESQGKRVRGRAYPWGIVEVENMEHNDFMALKSMLVRMHMQDLKDVTSNVHYENFRCRHLGGVPADGTKGKNSKSPLLQMEDERKEHVQKMKKMEAEMEQVFEMKVKEKKQKLKDSEADLQRRAEQMKKNLEQQERELNEKMKAFELERDSWLEQNRHLLDEQNTKKDKKKSLF